MVTRADIFAKVKELQESKQEPVKESFDVPASEFDSKPGYVVGAYTVNGETIKLVRMGNTFAPVKVVLDSGEDWKDADGAPMTFNGQAAALVAYKDMQSGLGSHNGPKPPIEDGGDIGSGASLVAASNSGAAGV
jgi:hypothetical protein